MPLTGDFAALDQIIDQLDDPIPELALNLAEETLELIAESFANGEAPDGTPWADLAIRDGQILVDNGTLRDGWHVVSYDGHGFEVGSSVWYADVHQNGATVPKDGNPALLKIPGIGLRFCTVQIPARPMVPGPNELPAAWDASLEETAKDFLDDWFSSR